MDGAADRESWQATEEAFVDAIAPCQPWELAARGGLCAEKDNPHAQAPHGDGSPDGDADRREHLALAHRIDTGSADTDTDRSQPGV